MRQISDFARQELKHLEGLCLEAYRDQGGILTIGYGHTSQAGLPKVYEAMKISQEEAERIFENDLKQYEIAVSTLVKKPLNQGQFDALVLFCYNIGVKRFSQSRLLRQLNRGAYDVVPSELMRWVLVNKKTSNGLVHRRTAEIAFWHSEKNSAKNYDFGGNCLSGQSTHMPWFRPQHGLAILAPLCAFGSAVADMIAQAPALQITLALLVLPGLIFALYYYFRYHTTLL